MTEARRVVRRLRGFAVRGALPALALALLIPLAGCAAPSGVRGPGSEPRLRVALMVDASEVRIGGAGGVTVRAGEGFRLPPGNELRLVPMGEQVRMPGRGSAPADRVSLQSASRTEHLRVNGRAYRGSVDVFARNGSLVVVNQVGLEAYLRGVVNAEMGTRTRGERAALEAQAIVSRTYALSNLGRFRREGYDLRATVSDQAYLGARREDPLGAAAVEETAGMVLTYRGRPITPFFHSTCGYSTAAPVEAFRDVEARPYLVPISDRRQSGGYYCDISPRFRWSVEWDGDQLRDILRRTVPTVLGVNASLVEVVRDVRVHQKGPSGRVLELRVGVGQGDIPVFGPDIRRVLETPEGRALGSTAIELTATSGAAGVEQLRVSGAGWGHGVGMCQWGAIGRARAGQNARSILSSYFPGTRIERWY